ncbi:hypothetical protein B0H19DRAFT_472983 [Mycena capillaripes]|nr:hypothetical protein B0H19DRAFT_472983 [Mycena capillaripes]
MCYSSTSRRMVAPIHARFCGKETPGEVIEILQKLKCPNLVHIQRPELSVLISASTTAGHLGFVDPTFVKEIVHQKCSSLTRCFTNKEIGTDVIHAVLLFLLEGESSISGLPLLIRADNSLVCVREDGGVIYAPPNNLISTATGIFPADRFIRAPPKARDLLFRRPVVNVKPFDETGVLALLQERIPNVPRYTPDDRDVALIAKFWDSYERLPGPPQISLLDTLPLIRTMDGEYISAAYCRDHSNAISQPGEADSTLMSALQKLGVVFYRLPPPYPASYAKRLTLQTCIRAIPSTGAPFSKLSPTENDYISEWIRPNVYYCTDADRIIVSTLPIWKALRAGEEVLLPASQVEMLPFLSMHVDTFAAFLPPTVALASYSVALDTVMKWSSSRPLSAAQLAGMLVLPHNLTDANLEGYSRILQEFFSFQDGREWQLPVPDGNLTLRPVKDLYDHSQALFSQVLSLGRSDRELFLHPSFVNLTAQLKSRGLKTDVDWNSFLQCARCIQTALTETRAERRLSEDDLLERAEIVYDFYNSRLPGQVMANQDKWEQLSRIPFIARKHLRSTSTTISFSPQSYCLPLPVVVSPSQLVRQQYERVAWTQRALFQNEPGPNLVAVNPSLGVPHVKEVVAHLVVLAVQIAPNHPGDQILLQHLQATYQWLDENREEAREHLLCHTQEALFLNVDDPRSEPWEWRAATELLFDIEYDYPETKTFQVRQFLQNHRPLLLAAGAGSEHAVDFQPKTKAPDGNALRDAFDAMQKAGQLWDVVLVPSETMDEGTDTKPLRAHSSFLAAAIPHVREGLLGWAEGSSNRYSSLGHTSERVQC